ncbi:MAG: hypothetical protein KDI37_10695 [Xanthomonadales bacterium]|nr:hypothetical protein [Xanthomonadales bacterium]MCB1635043.1 hypothetical protein [Xanthomonadales bacterium]MCB1642190.1 hypothetical protein [Xanthomonadales bacterium]
MRCWNFDSELRDGAMAMNQDLKEFLRLLVSHEVEFMLVGSYAVAMHGFVRNTEDIDFWVRKTPENADRIMAVLDEFGFGDLGFQREDITGKEAVIQLGRPPHRIDLLNFLTALDFEDCWDRRLPVSLGGTEFAALGLADLLRNKKATGRPKDLADVAEFENERRPDAAPRSKE